MNENEVINEAARCLNCANPQCRNACPLEIDIPRLIKSVKFGDFNEAAEIIFEKSYLGSICGRVCPHEKQCKGSCIRGINGEAIDIGTIEAFVSDKVINSESKSINSNGKHKVAIIGSGPSGLQCAAKLKKAGINVTIFEKENDLGGILTYGIPDFRLPNNVVNKVVSNIINMGVEVKTSKCFGKDFILQDLWNENFDAVFLGIGTEKSKILNIDGINLDGVYGANEFLKSPEKVEHKKVVVIGGGNVAMDVANVCLRSGAEVSVVYRRERKDMPANNSEIEDVISSGGKFVFKSNVVKIHGDKFVQKVEINDGTYIDADKLIFAIGAEPRAEYLTEFEKTENGLLKIDEYGETSIKNVYAAGDLVQSKATVCMAIKTANTAAERIISMLGEE